MFKESSVAEILLLSELDCYHYDAKIILGFNSFQSEESRASHYPDYPVDQGTMYLKVKVTSELAESAERSDKITRVAVLEDPVSCTNASLGKI